MGYAMQNDADVKIGAADKKLPRMVANQKAAEQAEQKAIARVLKKPDEKPFFSGGRLPSEVDQVNEKLKQANIQIGAQKQALGAQPARKSQLGPLQIISEEPAPKEIKKPEIHWGAAKPKEYVPLRGESANKHAAYQAA